MVPLTVPNPRRSPSGGPRATAQIYLAAGDCFMNKGNGLHFRRFGTPMEPHTAMGRSKTS
jgi:hypothetical protein